MQSIQKIQLMLFIFHLSTIALHISSSFFVTINTKECQFILTFWVRFDDSAGQHASANISEIYKDDGKAMQWHLASGAVIAQS